MPATVAYVPEFPIIDACDRCGMPAQLRVVFDDDRCLLFCGYHARRHHDALQRLDVVLELSPA